jgi:hypothetical protein
VSPRCHQRTPCASAAAKNPEEHGVVNSKLLVTHIVLLEIRGQKFVVRRDRHFGNRDREVSVSVFVALGRQADMPENEEQPELRPFRNVSIPS